MHCTTTPTTLRTYLLAEPLGSRPPNEGKGTRAHRDARCRGLACFELKGAPLAPRYPGGAPARGTSV